MRKVSITELQAAQRAVEREAARLIRPLTRERRGLRLEMLRIIKARNRQWRRLQTRIDRLRQSPTGR